jgi:cation transport regulator ChaB
VKTASDKLPSGDDLYGGKYGEMGRLIWAAAFAAEHHHALRGRTGLTSEVRTAIQVANAAVEDYLQARQGGIDEH